MSTEREACSRLIEQWEARARKAFPTDAMLINRHIRELHEALAQPVAASDVQVPNTFKLPGESDEAWVDRITGAQPVAADAEDAAKWREHVGKLDALVAFCPTCCEGKTAAADMTRDDVIFQCGRTSGKSEAARAARPTPA